MGKASAYMSAVGAQSQPDSYSVQTYTHQPEISVFCFGHSVKFDQPP